MKYTRNRRAVEDRRMDDKGPPAGWRERRNSVERRKPEVREITFAEWIACMRERPCEVQ